ncbi:hypothetical protein ACJJI5_11340 [Microbulbifer sp. EKSA008]|uniref:hypothetical protein n=1 Tax=Microbulbifer sp. EKSA008 TaxID=3243367 RepID=UPI004042BCA6
MNEEARVIEMPSVSGGWDDVSALSEGRWKIVKYTGANEGYWGYYFSSFKVDGNNNNQFLHNGFLMNALLWVSLVNRDAMVVL